MPPRRYRKGQPQAGRQEAGRPSTKRTANISPRGRKTSRPSPRPTSSLDEKGRIVPDLCNARQAGNFVLKHARRDRIHRRQPQAARLGGRQPDSVPRKRRRQPRVDGIEHATPGRAAAARRRSLRGHRHGARHRPRFGRGGALQARRRGGFGGFRAHHRARGRRRAHEGQLSREVGADIYQLTKFKRSNQNTCINQKPIVPGGAARGEGRRCWPTVLAPIWASWLSAATCWWPSCPGAAATSKTPSWSAKSWSRKTTTPRSTSKSSRSKPATPSSGPEEITRDIPNIADSFLRNLDESGVIRIGATVKPGDILVGKVTPKGETQLTPEEKLLRAIFGEKAGDVKDASLYCPPGIEGTVVDCKIFSRKGQEKDERSKAIEESQIAAPAAQPAGRNPHPDRRARQAPRQSCSKARSCWPTCTTKRPTSACSPKTRT